MTKYDLKIGEMCPHCGDANGERYCFACQKEGRQTVEKKRDFEQTLLQPTTVTLGELRRALNECTEDDSTPVYLFDDHTLISISPVVPVDADEHRIDLNKA